MCCTCRFCLACLRQNRAFSSLVNVYHGLIISGLKQGEEGTLEVPEADEDGLEHPEIEQVWTIKACPAGPCPDLRIPQ